MGIYPSCNNTACTSRRGVRVGAEAVTIVGPNINPCQPYRPWPRQHLVWVTSGDGVMAPNTEIPSRWNASQRSQLELKARPRAPSAIVRDVLLRLLAATSVHTGGYCLL